MLRIYIFLIKQLKMKILLDRSQIALRKCKRNQRILTDSIKVYGGIEKTNTSR